MNDFDAAVLRLKGQVGVTEDQALAALLGLSKASFSDRKKRDSFPADKLRALAQQRPDLNIDVDYVITGVAQAALEMIQAAREGKPLKKVSADDAALLSAWHTLSKADQRLLFDLLMRLNQGAVALTSGLSYPKAEEAVAPALHERRRKSL